MDYEKKFYELLRSPQAKQIICEAVKEEASNMPQESRESWNPFSKSVDSKKTAKLQESLRLAEEERNSYRIAYQKINNELRSKDLELNRLQTQLGNMQREKERLEGELSSEKMAYGRTSSELQELKADYKGMQTELAAAKRSYESLRSSFAEPMDCHEKYLMLSESTKKGLSNVICYRNVPSFLATCTNADNLKKMWEYTKEILSDDRKQKDVEILKEVFDYFFDLYNQSLVEPIYERDSVETGDDYDDEYYSRSRESATSGRISKVLLRGYSSINTGKRICKSVVRV